MLVLVLGGVQMALTSSSSHLLCTSEARQSRFSEPGSCIICPCSLGAPSVKGLTSLNFHLTDLVDRSLTLWGGFWKAALPTISLPLPCPPSAAGPVGQGPCLVLGGSAGLLPDGPALPARELQVCENCNYCVGPRNFF